MNKERLQPEGISRNVWTLGWVSFLNDVSSEMIYPLLPLFLTSILGVGTAFVGLIEGVAESTASILKAFSGWLSDRLKKRKSLVLGGYTVSALTRPIIALATSGWHILIIRFLDRTGKGARTSPRDALIAESTEPAWTGRAFGFQRAMDHLGAVVGPLILLFLLATLGGKYRTIFLLAAIPAIFSLILIKWFVTEKKDLRESSAPAPKLNLRTFDRRFKTFLLIMIVFTLGNSSDAFLIIRANEQGITLTHIPLLWLILHVVKSAVSMPGGIMSDRIGRKKVIIAGWIIYGLVYLGLAACTKTYHIWLLFAVYGIYFGLTEGAEKALVADLVPREKLGTAYGLYNFAVGITALPASLLMGFLWQLFGPGIAFCFGAGLGLISAGLMTILIKERG
ncbi:MAG: MFS transporter [Deltaproteobacteria bacterium]|nr:MAG: MFS transporter [Deltaproteobacteria bacterium]